MASQDEGNTTGAESMLPLGTEIVATVTKKAGPRRWRAATDALRRIHGLPLDVVASRGI
jgi:hypothetical protein